MSEHPYLSVVVTTRNDDHGGDPLQRFQAFVHSFVSQCKRYHVQAEILVVEWNPPADRPRIIDTVRWPEDLGSCMIRIIEVPPEIHNRMRGSQSLPLFQMIGKNVGIRRARGEFILSTNIDIVFSNELFAFIASRQLARNASYRVVRYDVEQGFPQDVDSDTLLRYCQTHQIRGQFPNGTFPLERDGTPAFFEDDIAKPGGIRLGTGWHVREGLGTGRAFRWVGDRAELLIIEPLANPRRLYVDLRPNPFSPAIPIKLRVTDSAGAVLARFTVTVLGRHLVTIPAGPPRRQFWIEVEDATGLDEVPLPAFESRDQLRYVAVGVGWEKPDDAGNGSSARLAGPAAADRNLVAWEKVHDANPTVEFREDGLHLTTMTGQSSYNLAFPILRALKDGVHTFILRYRRIDGDVTFGPMQQDQLWWRPHEIVRTVEGDELIATLSVPLKEGDLVRLLIANNHPAGDHASRVVIRALEYGDHVELARVAGDEPMTERIQGALLRGAKALLPMKVKDVGKMIVSRALLRMVEWQTGNSLAEKVYEKQLQEREVDRLAWERAIGEVVNANEELQGRLQRLDSLQSLYAFLKRVHPASVHANACGDFLLMAREHWFELRAYAEFETYSMNVDGLFSYTAHYGGAPEQRLSFPLCIYHMEHAIGSGWTPEGGDTLRERMRQGQVDWLDWQTVALWASFMRWLDRPMIFNPETWGLADVSLPETELSPQHAE